jgi:hypothetical protein
MSALPIVPPLEPVGTLQTPVATQPYFVAVLIDDVAQQVMNIDGQTAALFLSQPKFVQCPKDVVPGMVYNQTANTWSTVDPTA